MVDPFSTVAGAAGIITLGLQVCGGFIKYCNEWKSYNVDIEESLEKLTELEHTLKTIGDTLRIVEDIDYSTTDNLQLARRKIYSTQANLNKLYSSLKEVESIDGPAGMLDKVHNLRLRSTRFLSRGKFNSWRSSITEIHSNLLSAIQFLQLHLAMSSSVMLKDLAKANNEGIDKISDTIERTIVQRFELQGQQLSRLHRDVLSTSSQPAQVSLQQTQTRQQVTQDTAALQLGVMQKPSLLHMTLQENRRMLSQNMDVRSRPFQPCTCRALFKYKPLFRSRSYNMDGKNLTAAQWNAGFFTNTLVHRPGCPEVQEEKQIGLKISFGGCLIQGAIQAAMSMTRGAGGFSISPILAFSPVVPSGTGPFRVFRMVDELEEIHASDLRTAFRSWTQELLQLYQAGKASPRDVDEEGNNIMHIACTIFSRGYCRLGNFTVEVYFEFLRNLYDLGVSLNTTNAEGMTPLGTLLLAVPYGPLLLPFIYGRAGPRRHKLVTSITPKMVNLGAELPILTQETTMMPDSVLALGLGVGQCPEVAEAFSCSEISKAIQAKDLPWLKEAVLRKPELIDEPNIMGQTSLHFSVVWPAGIQMLLETSADVDAIDRFGNTPIFYAVAHCVPESIKMLGRANCRLTVNQSIVSRNPTGTGSILQWATATESHESHKIFRPEASRKDVEAMFNASVSLVAERRRSLEALVQTLLGAQAVKRLQIAPGAVLDRKASFAISMLRGKDDVPDSMMAISPSYSTVYHIPQLNVRQARIFWDNGFRDVDELDDLGQSALMKCDPGYLQETAEEYLKFVAWLVDKGAKLHNRQKYTFRKRKAYDRVYEPDELAEQVGWVERDEIFRSNDSSSTAALHYLATRWAFRPNTDGYLASSEEIPLFIRTVLTAPLSDCCDCACSDGGCAAYTSWMKETRSRHSLYPKDKVIRRRLRYLAQSINLDTPSLVWLRRGIVRVSTFVRLELNHTCCKWHEPEEVIYKPYEEEDIVEIKEEQSEGLEKLEALLIEFEDKYNESTWLFSEFIEGYWEDRMAEIMSEELPIDHRALENIGVRLRRTGVNSLYRFDEVFEVSDPEDERTSEVSNDGVFGLGELEGVSGASDFDNTSAWQSQG